MKTVLAGQGYGDMTKKPPVGAGATFNAKAYRNGKVYLECDEIEKALKDFVASGHDADDFWIILRGVKAHAIETAFPPEWMKKWVEEQRQKME